MTDKFPGFTVVRRGYDRREVDRFLLGGDGGPLGEACFSIALRGYDRGEVDAFLAMLRAAGVRTQTGAGIV
ncbi:DivIVA domain-containing protein [Yinghuangia aomiensis]